MTESASPLVWLGHFPGQDRRSSFFLGVPVLGPDLSFFTNLQRQQAARTEQVMAAWIDQRERRVALSLGECLQRQWGWRVPYFIPADHTMAVVCGPDFWAYFEFDLANVFEEFNKQLGTRMTAGFWETVIDWDDKSVSFEELVRKVTAELGTRGAFDADERGPSA